MPRRVLCLLTGLLVGLALLPGVLEASADTVVVARVNFGPVGAPVPAGYVADTGAAFDAGRGYGWVAQDSATPLSMVGNGRDRNKVADQRLDTLMHMQLSGTASGVKTPGRWEHGLPAGTYDVTVSVGDPSYIDSTHRLTVEGTLAVDNFRPTTSNLLKTASVRVTVVDGRLTLDAAGGTNTKLDYVDIDRVGDPPPRPSARVNFAPVGAVVPPGYVADTGAAFDAGRGYGWVAQDSAAPLSLVGNGRDRNKVSDQRLDTLIHMQFTGSGAGVRIPGRWEYALPAGAYDVVVAVGDPGYTDSTHRLTVEGTLAVNDFKPTASSLFRTAAVRVTVSDGRLTLDAVGGTNTKVDYVTIDPADATAVNLIGAGDIAKCDLPEDTATAELMSTIPGTVFTAGDNVYESGTPWEFSTCYEPTWGQFKTRTRPALGNHEYAGGSAAGHFQYYGDAAGPADQGYYSYDLGGWHIVVLNSNCEFVSCAAGSPQEQWLRADLAASTAPCTLAYWHHPRFSSGAFHANATGTAPFWNALYENGAEVVVNGHDHDYERFAPQRPDTTGDPLFGIREFIVGTGGAELYGFGPAKPNSELRNAATHGVMKFTLRAGSYDWEFIPIPGKTFRDSGTGTCHGRPTP